MSASLTPIYALLLIIYMKIIQLRGANNKRNYLIRSGTPGGNYDWWKAPDVNVILGPGVTAEHNNWVFNVSSQYGADLTIELGPNTWGLHPNEISHYNIQFAGSTHTDDDGELLVVVSSGNNYFAQLKSLDTTLQQYQECPPSNSPLLQQNVSKIINSATPDRYNRYCNNSEWNDQGFEESTIWPNGFFLWSNPVENTLNYSWYHDFYLDDEIPEFHSYYTSTFPVNQGFKIYISGDKMGHSFTIGRIHIWYQTHTIVSPTIDPTQNPTIQPTLEPTTALEPTVQPTFEPTTLSPTVSGEPIIIVSSTLASDSSQLVFFVSFVLVFCVLIVF